MAWLINLQPLYISKTYRKLWISSTLSAIGNHITIFAVILQIYTITHSSIAVGVIGLFTGVPAILLALWGGTLIDKFDRRQIVLVTITLQTIACSFLWLYSLLDGKNIFFLYSMLGWIFLLGAINVPAASAILPRLIDSQHIQSAVILRIFSAQAAMILGPLLGGLLEPRCGISTLYFMDLLSFCIALYGIWQLPAINPITQTFSKRSWEAIKEGFQFVKSSSIILGALYVDLALAFFGMPNALFPSINDIYFNGYPDKLGLMIAAPSLGGLIAMLFSGHLNHLKTSAIALVVFCTICSLTIISFSLSTSFIISLILLFFMGAFDNIVVSLRSAVIQQATPDQYRGRVSALEYIVSNAAPQLGNFRAGLLATFITPHVVVLIGGISTLTLIFLMVFILPAFIKKTSPLVTN